MIWMTNPCYISNWNKTNKMVEAFRSPEVEFILAQHPWLENDCLFADIVLPGKSSFERTDLGFGNLGVGYWVVYCPQCIDPIGESKSDFETCLEIAKKLGVESEFTGGKTAEDLLKSAFNSSTAAKYINYEDWKRKGYFVIPFPPMDQYVEPKRQKGGPGIRWFYQQSEGSGINTPSGKIEFYSQNLAKYYPNDEERPPLPHYIPYGVTNQESLSHPRAKQYPLLICSNHPRWRHHARYDGSSWVREIPEAKILNGGYYYEPIWINPTDAQARGIKHGDVVKVYNERGTVIMGAYVTERIMPGVVMASEGAAYDPVDVGNVDKGGCINSISPNILSRYAWGMNVSGFLLQIEKWQGPVPQSIREKRMTGG